jgi:uncharacterized protein YndB with AHSA1/START domain
MSNDPTVDFSVNRENKRIKVKRQFAAERSLVWKAYTNSDILDQWWAPKPWKARTKAMDFREGGRWEYAMVGPAGEEHWCRVDYHHIQPEEKFTAVDCFTDPEGNPNKELPMAKWEVMFTGKQDLTLVEIDLSFDDLSQLDAIIKMGFREGFAMAMVNLDALLPALAK